VLSSRGRKEKGSRCSNHIQSTVLEGRGGVLGVVTMYKAQCSPLGEERRKALGVVTIYKVQCWKEREGL